MTGLPSIQNLCLYDNLNLPLFPKRSDEQILFACCPFAGPIAISIPSKSPNSSMIGIYMQNGAQIASINASNALYLFWTKCLKLIVINNVGRVLLYDALGKLLKTSTMGENFPWAKTEGQYIKMELDNDQCQLLLLHDSKIMQLIDVEVDDFQCLKQIKLEFNGEIGQIFWCGKSSFAIEQKLESSNNLSIYSLEGTSDLNQTENMGNTFNS
uniref:Vps16 N-terminal domain-containing protein n=1 Tax=Meloidogyne javanica TaxID=6303 RepID=A0A915LTB4_MELJA